ncbi:hypothetical protein [Nonomuraea sp. NPDC050643]|uniref:hypothetical protein n=1 Tax=Nonomuraea sp. NPDC050643 TaxID=3155660 RepID=UPI0033C8C27B
MSRLDVDIAIYGPRTQDLFLHLHEQSGLIALRLSDGAGIRFVLGTQMSDREAEAQAMDRLAELATQAAGLLRNGGA